MNIQSIIIALIIGAAAVRGVCAVFRNKSSSACSGCSGCPHAASCGKKR